MRRTLILIVTVLAAVAGWAYLYPSAAILTAVKVRTAIDSTRVAPSRDIAWQQGPQTATLSPVDRPPNIVLIVADDLGYNDISTFGGGVAGGRLQTPHIDALAAQGAVFTQSYSGSSTCAPSRAMLMTGRYSTRTGFAFTPMPPAMGSVVTTVANNMDRSVPAAMYDSQAAADKPPYELQGLPADEVTLAEALKSRGYHTAHIGKWHLGHSNGMSPNDQGFDDSLSLGGSYYLPENDPNVVNAKFDTSIDKMIWASGQYAAQFNGGDYFAPDKYVTDYYTDEALKVIENNQHRPFFLYLSHWAIHNPLQALRSDVEEMNHMRGHNLQVYSGMIRALDRSVGKIVEKLKDLDIYGKTLIIFTSDNGGANYIELEDINKPFRGWKISFFEGGIRVPFIASWPNEIDSGLKFNQPVHHFDIFSTIAAAAQTSLPADRKIDGVNLLPFIKSAKTKKPHKTLFWRSGNHQAVLHEDWKYIISEQENLKWLFNTNLDPHEKNNLIESHPEELKLIENLLGKFNSEQKDPLFPSSTQMPILIDKYDGQIIEEKDEYIYWSN